MNRRRLIIGLIIVVVVGAIIWRARAGQNNQSQIVTSTVTRETIIEEITSSGKTLAKEQADLHFLAGGRLAWVGVKEGDSVSQYQALASLDTQELQKNLEKALRDYSKERNDFDEDNKVVYKDRVITDTVKRILEKNQWDLEKAVLDVELKNIAFQWSTLISPINGIVIGIDTPVAGVNASVTDTITVANPSSMVFSASVDETDVGKLSIGQVAEIELDAYPDKNFLGTISKIGFSAETSSTGATVFPVEISFSETENVRIGLNGDVVIKYKESQNVLSIPIDSLKEDENQKAYVVIKENNTYRRQPVTIGLQNDSNAEILDGLTENSVVVTEGFQYLPENIQ